MTTELFGKPDLFQAKRVLVVQPHYDDNDIAVGGTLAKLAAQGSEIFYLSLYIPSFAFTNQGHSYQFTIAAHRSWPGTFQKG